MKIAIHQPNFMPYLGFFDKCDYADILVIYNSTQFKKNDFQNRNRIKVQEGWTWLTIPVRYNFGDPISKVKITKNIEWKKRHLNLIRDKYSKSPYYNQYIKKIKKIYSMNWHYLSDFNVELIRFLFKELGINTKIIFSSELDIQSKSSEALANICEKLGGDDYISGKDGKKYLEENKFYKKGIKITFQDYQHPKYSQQFGNFEPFMGILDILFNEGPNSLKIIKAGRCYRK